jgi:membrane protein DedA with SNARE-associated domain/membrane-associated phospholipid phosphatase
MTLDILHPILDWTRQHPQWAELAVFGVAFGESLAVVGLLLPGIFLLFGAGALIALGVLDMWTTLACAALGASLGDGISFWIGRHYHQRLRVMWPLRRYPELLNRGVDFFCRHGGKSILLGRFIGPLRPFIPAVAGMLDMPVWRYVAINIVSALAWAPVYILPGVVFGASLDLAGEVAGRLVMLLALLVAVVMVTLWLARRVFVFVTPRAGDYLNRLLVWGAQHPLLGRLSGTLVDPTRPEARGLMVFGAILLLSAWAFFRILHGVLGTEAQTPLDLATYQLLQGLRTPWADSLMVLITELGDVQVYVPVTLALCGWLLLRRRTGAMLHLLGAVGFSVLIGQVLKYTLRMPRPPAMQYTLHDPSFPSGHATINMALYGFCALLIARELTGTRRWLPYLCTGLFIVPVAFSRIYLGAHWLSDVLGGLTLGMAWTALLGIAYRRHSPVPIGFFAASVVIISTLLLAGGWHALHDHRVDMQRYALRHESQHWSGQDWWQRDWRRLPAYRGDLRGQLDQPLTVQWAGDLDTIRAQLAAQGWRQPVKLSPATTLLWLSPDPQLAALPVLPQVHDGRHEVLRMTHPGNSAASQYVLRLWPSYVLLDDTHQHLWIGNVSELGLARKTPLIAYLRSTRDFDLPLAALQPALTAWDWRQVARRENLSADEAEWHGEVLLIRGKQ